jgi:hypothetical protein
MNAWQWEIFEDVVNPVRGLLSVTPGPLYAPIEELSIRRNEDRELVLSTTAEKGARSSAMDYPAGTVRRNDDTLQFTTATGFTGVARGVAPQRWVRTLDSTGEGGTTSEEGSLHSLTLTSQRGGDGLYTIEWIENFPADSFTWPSGISDRAAGTESRVIGRGADAITLEKADKFKAGGGDNHCVGLKVSNIELYVSSATLRLEIKQLIKPGFIFYKGTPDQDTRNKIRNCISFSLGSFLVYLGCTVLDTQLDPMSITAVNADRLLDRASKVGVLPPAPLERRYEREVDPQNLSRLVNGLYAKYETLNLGPLLWAYWHAVCAPTHIAAAHFGAAIEALQDAYVNACGEEYQTKLITEKEKWRQLQANLTEAVKAAGLASSIEAILLNKISGLNSVPRSKLSDQVFDRLGIRLGEQEARAWRQRHLAAHGDSMDEDPIAIIRETKLLKLIFHRILLKITNGSDTYRDYYSLKFPIRKLEDPVS